MSETIKRGDMVYLLWENRKPRVKVLSVHANPLALTVVFGGAEWIVCRHEVMTAGERRTMLERQRMANLQTKLREKYADLLAAYKPGDTHTDIAVKLEWLPVVAFNKLEACRHAGLLL